MNQFCYEINCVKEKSEWRFFSKKIIIKTKYGMGWSDRLVDSFSINGYYMLYGDIYIHNSKAVLSPKISSQTGNDILGFIIDPTFDYGDVNDFYKKERKMIFNFLIDFSASILRDCKLEEIGI